MAGNRETPEERELRRHRDFLSAERARRCNECRGQQRCEEMEERRRRNEEAEMAKAYQREMWRKEAANAPPYEVSPETPRQCSRHSMPVDDHATLPEGWTRNAVNVPVAPRLSGQECIDFVMRKWLEMSYEQNLDPKYSISAPYWHAVVEAEYETRRAGIILPTGARELTPELSVSDDDAAAADDSKLPDLPLPTAGASWSAASPAPEKGAPAEPGEASHQARRRSKSNHAPAVKVSATAEAMFLKAVADG